MFIASFLSYYVGIVLMREQSALDGDYEGFSILDSFNTTDYNIHEKALLTSIIKPDMISINFENVIGHSSTKKKLESLIIKPLKYKSMYNNYKLLEPPNGIILHGPPGTGKTMLVKALCKELHMNFINFDINQIEQKLFGESAKMLKALFTLANKLKPCIVFIDEIDGFFGERNPMDQSFVNGIKTQMLSLMDGIIDRDSSIIFIATTNRLQSVDPAIKRRMRTHIKISLPSTEERTEMFKYNLNDFPDIQFDELAQSTSGFTGCDIHEICKLAAHSAVDDSSNHEFCIETRHVQDVIDTFEL